MRWGAVVVLLVIFAGGGPVDAARNPRHGTRRKVDVNAASAHELADVPGLGPKLAAAVVESRDRDGPFESAAQLTRVKGIGAVKAPRVAQYLVFPRSEGPGESLDPWRPDGERPSHPVDLNVAHAGELAALPGMGWALAYRVIAERERNGAFRALEDLYYVAGVRREMVESWRAYLYVE